MSFHRILPDSSYLSGAILKFLSKFWRKNEFSSVKCLSLRSFKFFSSLVQLFHSSSLRSASTILRGVSRRHSRILKTEQEFLFNPVHSLKDSWFKLDAILSYLFPIVRILSTHLEQFRSLFSLVLRSSSSQNYSFQLAALVLQILPVHRSSDL